MRNFSDLLIKSNASLKDALNAIDKGSSRVVFVTNDKDQILGILTDGDMRRAILKGGNFSEKIYSFMNQDFLYVNENYNLSNVKKLMVENSINQVPVLDKDGKLKDIIVIENFITIKTLDNPVVIMAGGQGKRLRPYTEKCPKPMLLLNEKPILEIILNKCIEAGFKNFHFSVNYLKEKIINYFKDGKSWNVSISYLIEEKPLGTAGPLSLLSKKGNEPILIMNGDVITELDYAKLIEFHKSNNSLATICVKNHEVNIPFGVVEIEEQLLKSFTEKPKLDFLINAGVYVINPKALILLDNNSYIDMPDLLEKIISSGSKVSVFPIHEYWIDIGKKESFNKAAEKYGD